MKAKNERTGPAYLGRLSHLCSRGLSREFVDAPVEMRGGPVSHTPSVSRSVIWFRASGNRSSATIHPRSGNAQMPIAALMGDHGGVLKAECRHQ